MSGDEGSGGDDQPDDGRNPRDFGVTTANVFGVMEDIADKLKILDYETLFCRARRDQKPLSRTYFALPGKASDQFPYFSNLTAWLLKEMNVDFMEWAEFDDPNQISNTILAQLKKLGFVSDFPVTKLRHGSGESVCFALNFLLDQCLTYKAWEVKPPKYVNPEYAEDAMVDEDAEIADDGDVAEEDLAEDDDTVFNENDYFQPKIEKDEEEKKDQEILEATVDPIEWKMELERVQHRLKFKAQPASKEWRTHIEQSQKHEKSLNEYFPDAKVALEKIGKELRTAVERISSKERHINKEFDHLGGEFREKQKKLDEIQEKYNELSQSVSELTTDLAEKTEMVEMIKNSMSERNNSMTDTSPLRSINTALATLKAEVAEMELRIGVVGQTLLQSKLKHAHHHHQNHKGSAHSAEKASLL